MTFKAEFTFDTVNELLDFLGGKTTAIATVQDAEPVKRKNTRGPKPVVPVENDEPEHAEEAVAEPPKKAAPEPVNQAPAEPKITYEYVAKATAEAVKAAGSSQPVKDILQQFGVTTARELPESEWAAYMKRCGELIKSKDEALA